MEFRKVLEAVYKEGVYIFVDLSTETQVNINKYMKENLKGIQKNKRLHATLIYSQKAFNGNIALTELEAEGKFSKFSNFGPENEVIVVEVDCPTLVTRNKELVEQYGFISDYDEYKPHVTLAYNAADFDISTLPPIDFPIVFVNEQVEALKTDWKDSV